MEQPESKASAGSNSPVDVDDLIRQYFARIHRAALVLSGNPWDADDLAQETFLVMARQPGQFQGRSSIYTFLYGILLNLDRRERRRYGMRRRKLQVLWDNEPTQPRTTPAADAAAEAGEWKNSLWGRVAKLPDGQRQALVLRFSEQLRYDEIAEALDCPLGTVKSRIFHGLLALRRVLEEEGEDAQQLPEHPYEDLSRAI
ncbi:MAG TPA: RNA polymerase sigma factor [Pirellulaceae bacterium]|nr:RNA polymerase sigma factor [Pirellulaceae bacterium]